jgi:hypothetical protein
MTSGNNVSAIKRVALGRGDPVQKPSAVWMARFAPRLDAIARKPGFRGEALFFSARPASEDEPLAKTLQRPAVAAETFAGKPLPAAFDLGQGFA